MSASIHPLITSPRQFVAHAEAHNYAIALSLQTGYAVRSTVHIPANHVRTQSTFNSDPIIWVGIGNPYTNPQPLTDSFIEALLTETESEFF